MKNLLSIILLLILGVVFYSFTLRGIWGNPPATDIKNNLDQVTKPFELSPERSRYLLTQNLSERNSIALSKDQAEAAFPDVGYYKGNFYIFFAPGISFLALPFYNLGLQFNLAQVASFFSVTIFAIANLIVIFIICRQIFKFQIWISLITSIVFGFGSVAWSYAGTLYQHHATTFLIYISFYLVWLYKKHNKRGYIWGLLIWLNYSLAIFIDYPNAILMLPIMIYFFLTALSVKRDEDQYIPSIRFSFLVTSIIFVTVMILHGYMNYVNFGDFKRLSGSLIGYKYIKDKGLDNGNLDQNLEHQLNSKNPVGFFKEEKILSGAYTLLFAPDKGIFIFSPVFIFGFIGMIIAAYKRRINLETGILIATVLTTFFLYFSWSDPWGGWAYGPRYLIPAMAGLAILIGIFLKYFNNVIYLMIFYFLFLISAGISLMGGITTNAVPPQVEADYLKIKYGVPFVVDFLNKNLSGSFLYNYYFNQIGDLTTYYILILGTLSIFSLIIIFAPPLFSKKGADEIN